MEDYKKLLTDLYTINDPERIKQIDYFLERYKGKEKQFYISQKAKYKSKKPVSDSKKIIEEALARIKSQSEDKAKKDTREKPIENKTPVAKQPVKKVEPPKKVEEKAVEKEVVKNPIQKLAKKEPLKEKEILIKETQKEIKTETPKPKESKKEDVWFEEKTKKPTQTQTPQVNKPNPHPLKKDKHFNKKYFLYIFGSVLLVIILAVILYFFFFYSSKKETNTEKPKTNITTKTIKTEPKKAKTVSPTKTKANTTKPKVQKTQPKQNRSISSGTYIKKGSIRLPAYFVACSAVKNENLAIKKANELKAKGFDASYYWIPDFVTQGNPYFKVVIGPFSKRMDAMRKLTPVQERAEFDAYVLELK
jgi:cell division septation protein DedD